MLPPAFLQHRCRDFNDDLDPEDEANLAYRHMYQSEVSSTAGEVGTKFMKLLRITDMFVASSARQCK